MCLWHISFSHNPLDRRVPLLCLECCRKKELIYFRYSLLALQWDVSTGSVNINKIHLSKAILRSTEQGKGYLIYILILFCCSRAPLWGLYKCVKEINLFLPNHIGTIRKALNILAL